ncbi:uncharacterized protein LOC118477387 isoform X1 [Aplysia californica]|uniref:Uncharacterized protein LOC118477387 isoform X1 n=1 Tax=Aplysia californica TaxID=6500 RepID=A0ABM1VQB8_APLCA|nr:uncharacterized protein LOC118477387 isoform X1 [Aplysia californica]
MYVFYKLLLLFSASSRLRLLQRVLSSSRLPLRLVTAVMSWKSELFKQPQQDKFPSGRGHHAHQQHLVDSPPQDNSRVFVSGNGKDQTKFEHSATGPNPRRVSGAQRDEVAGLLDKFPEKTKAGSFDYEAQQSQGQGSLKSSSLGTGNTTSTDPTGDSFKVHDKILQKRNPNRGMLRAKSVEFNFNSSSTDGSVFDYERAVSGMQQGAIHSDGGLRVPQDRSYARKVRRGERSLRSGLHSSRIPRAALNDEQAFSDPSEMLGHSKHPSRGDTSTSLHTSSFGRDRDVGGREIHTDDGRTDEMMSERSLRRFAQADPSASSMKDTHYRTGHSENPSSLDMDSDERFVRLTFTPKDKLSSGSVFNFNMGSPSTVPGAHTAAHMMSINHPDTETESGIDATDALDPYDKVIKKIREISSSSVSNVEKLQQVCYLLSIDSPNDRNVENKDKFKSNLSHSTMDLRPRELQTFPNQDSIDSNTRSFSQMEKTERPVETVQRMKKNLAKSMEELNSLIGHSENPVEPSSSDKYFSHHSTGLEKGRYKSELKIHPVYNKPNVLIHSKEEVLPSSSHPQSSSFDLSNASSAPLLKNDSQYQWPQNEMTMDVASKKLSFSSNSINALEDSRSHFDLSRPRYEESPQSDHMSQSPLDKYSQPPDFRDNYSQQLRRTNPSRPSSLNVFSNRNFISPSFLRPASSMRDLTSSGQHPLTLELLREIEIDAEYQTLQALEELDILKNLHEDFASNEYPYSKYEDEERDPPEEFRRTQKFGDNPDYSAFQRLEGSREQSFGSDSRQDAKSEHVNEFVVQSCLHAVEAKSNEAGAMNLDDDVRRESFARGDGQSLDSVPKDFRDSGKDVQSRSPQHLGIPEEDIDRLVSEAEQESHSQEEVALSLQKVQRMLEAEESRRNELLRHISDTSADVGDHGELGVGRRMSHTTSTDNGYGSWASKLVSAQSTSSDGAGFEPDAGVDADGLPACYVQENLCVGKNEWVKDSASSSSSEGHAGIIFRRLQSAKEASLDKSAQNASSDKPFQDDEFF